MYKYGRLFSTRLFIYLSLQIQRWRQFAGVRANRDEENLL